MSIWRRLTRWFFSDMTDEQRDFLRGQYLLAKMDVDLGGLLAPERVLRAQQAMRSVEILAYRDRELTAWLTRVKHGR